MSPIDRRAVRGVVSIILCGAAACADGSKGKLEAASEKQAAGCTPVSARAPAPPSDSSAVTQDVRAGRTYKCVLHAGDAPMRVLLVSDSAANTIARIELRRDDETAPLQTLSEGQVESPYRGADVFLARDLDDDGYLDLLLLSSWGATGNAFYNVWRWNTAVGRFAFDSTLSALSNPKSVSGRPCVTSRSGGGGADARYSESTLCLQQQHWVETAVENRDWLEDLHAYRRTVRERRSGSLVVTRVDTVRDTTQR